MQPSNSGPRSGDYEGPTPGPELFTPPQSPREQPPCVTSPGFTFLSKVNDLPTVRILTTRVSSVVSSFAESHPRVAGLVKQGVNAATQTLQPSYSFALPIVKACDKVASNALDNVLEKVPILKETPKQLQLKNVLDLEVFQLVRYSLNVLRSPEPTEPRRGYYDEAKRYIQDSTQSVKDKLESGRKMTVDSVNHYLRVPVINSGLGTVFKFVGGYMKAANAESNFLDGLNQIPETEPLSRISYTITEFYKTTYNFEQVCERVVHPKVGLGHPLKHPVTSLVMDLHNKYKTTILKKPIDAVIQTWSFLIYFKRHKLEDEYWNSQWRDTELDVHMPPKTE